MIVYKSNGQNLDNGDVVLWDMKQFYIVAYDMRICSYILYPLCGHSFPKQYVSSLDGMEWEYLGHISTEEAYSQLKIDWGIGTYTAHMEALLSHNP